MGKDTPRYFVKAKSSYYWQPSSELRALGWKSMPLGKDRTTAVSTAIARNADVDAWVKEGSRPLDQEKPATPAKVPTRPGSCNALFDLYQSPATNPDYPTNNHTKRHYDAAVAYMRKWIGPVPVRAVTPRMAKQRYDALAKTTPAQAAAFMRVARACFGKARFLADPGHPLYIGAKDNPFIELDLKGTDSEGRLWTLEERDAMVKASFEGNGCCYPSIGVAIQLNWWLGQRQADILALGRRALEGDTLTIRQNKTSRRVELPVAILPQIHGLFERAMLAQRVARDIESLTHLIVNEDTGQPWAAHAFRRTFREIREAAKLPDDLQFMHLRHTAVVEMEDAGATIPEIASVSGHSLQSVTTILERYGRRTKRQAANAINKRLEKEKKDGGG